MSTLADHIEAYIKQQLKESQTRSIEVSRAQLADVFSCVPSQINYVLTTRFSIERGYIVESRRGGGGYIRIGRIQVNNPMTEAIELVKHIGTHLTEKQMDNLLARLIDYQVITTRHGQLIRGIVQQETAMLDQGTNIIRASLVRAMLLVIFQVEA